MAQQAEPESGRKTGRPINWDVVGMILGAGAAIAGWVAVVGGARVWARLHAADIPATQTLAALPRELLVVEGLQTLLIPLLIGGCAAVFVYYSWPQSARRELVNLGRATDRKRREAAEEKRRKAAAEDKRRKAAAEKEQRGSADEGEDGGKRSRFLPDAPPPRQPVADREPAEEEAPKRITAPLFLLAGLIREYGFGKVVVSAGACAVLLLVLTLAIVGINWWFPLVGGGVGLGLAIAGWRAPAGWPKAALLLGAALAPLAGTLLAVLLLVDVGYVVGMFVVTVAAVWLTLGALVDRSQLAVAVTLFVALALWAGALGFLRNLGADDPELETAIVERKNAPTLSGFYLGGSGGDVYIASESKPRAVTLIKKDDVAALSFGEAVSVEPKDTGKEGEEGKTADKGGGTEPALTPDPTLRDVVAAAPGSLDGVPLRLEVMEPQLGKGLMVLNLRLTNLSTDRGIPRRLIIGSLLDDAAAGERSDQRDTLDGLSVADLDGSHRHAVAHDTEGRCLCSRQLARVAVEPGQSVRLYATFSPPPKDRNFTLQVDGFGSIPVRPHR